MEATGSRNLAGDRRSRVEVRWGRRDAHVAIMVAGLGLAVVAVGMALFGLPPVDLRSPLDHLGITCPLCGGTRAARLTTQGHFVEAWRYNPLGIGVVVVSVMVVVRAA